VVEEAFPEARARSKNQEGKREKNKGSYNFVVVRAAPR